MNKNIKFKVVWICHFSNNDVITWIKPWYKRKEIAQWIPAFINGFYIRKDIELHIISLHSGISLYKRHKEKGITYHFINYGVPFLGIPWQSFFPLDILTNYFLNKQIIKLLVNRIKPDIINLFGTENANYSSTILQFKTKYPILISIQGFASQLKGSIKLTRKWRKRMDIEEEILKSFKYFAGEQDSSNYISSYNPDHVFFRLYYPVNEILLKDINEKRNIYDCIYFGILDKIKGAEDFVKVIAEINKIKPDVKACIVGGGDAEPLKELAQKLNCKANIEFIGFLKTQKELFEYVKASKVFLAPPYFERLSMTIREAMFLKVPIVAYATGGVPYINEFDENIILVKTGDYKEMARKTIILLDNESLRQNLADNAYNYAVSEFGLEKNTNLLIQTYYKILRIPYDESINNRS
jgi:glycosyltransferase involved in cell wall biosynthesis